MFIHTCASTNDSTCFLAYAFRKCVLAGTWRFCTHQDYGGTTLGLLCIFSSRVLRTISTFNRRRHLYNPNSSSTIRLSPSGSIDGQPYEYHHPGVQNVGIMFGLHAFIITVLPPISVPCSMLERGHTTCFNARWYRCGLRIFDPWNNYSTRYQPWCGVYDTMHRFSRCIWCDELKANMLA